MLNMGGPKNSEEVEPFLTKLFLDRDIMTLPIKLGPWIVKRQAPKVAKKYNQIGSGSPIRDWTGEQGSLMTKILDEISPEKGPHRHYIGFRYANPLTEDTITQVESDS
ncbi:ferrochelatase, mitochondrial-like [Panonychus citri]|uniref:ferrochelatase, mitochondrial-like n=1 Tax=Panonychus citri TaxID=50023 RepID=UPI002307285B|nr:ferrochelatase, mitochondrial-like [Panonychus citri]XP_053214086.1 ferrochelatase, mitochondrial-like [Panonychus citri]